MNSVSEVLAAAEENRFTVDGYAGVAWWCAGAETAADADTVWDGIEKPTGNVLMVMVGDNRRFSLEPDEIEILTDGYCSECGQIGCGHGANV